MAKSKKVNLAASLNAIANPHQTEASTTELDSTTSAASIDYQATPHARPSRQGTKMIGAHLPEPVSRQLNILAAEQGSNNKALLREALNLLFERYGKPPIA